MREAVGAVCDSSTRNRRVKDDGFKFADFHGCNRMETLSSADRSTMQEGTPHRPAKEGLPLIGLIPNQCTP